jgi:hypothetical protein
MTKKYIIAKTMFTCFHKAVGVSSVNYVYLLTRTREKQRETERSQHVYDTKGRGGGTSSVTSLFVLLCAPSVSAFVLRIMFLAQVNSKCKLSPRCGVSIVGQLEGFRINLF